MAYVVFSGFGFSPSCFSRPIVFCCVRGCPFWILVEGYKMGNHGWLLWKQFQVRVWLKIKELGL